VYKSIGIYIAICLALYIIAVMAGGFSYAGGDLDISQLTPIGLVLIFASGKLDITVAGGAGMLFIGILANIRLASLILFSRTALFWNNHLLKH